MLAIIHVLKFIFKIYVATYNPIKNSLCPQKNENKHRKILLHIYKASFVVLLMFRMFNVDKSSIIIVQILENLSFFCLLREKGSRWSSISEKRHQWLENIWMYYFYSYLANLKSD